MEQMKVVAGALAGTAAMTIFSYFLSGKKDKNFKEPELLGEMVNRAFPQIEKMPAKVAGWMMHGSMGFIFTNAYVSLLRKIKFRTDLPDDVFVGFVNGVLGIGIWKLAFSFHPDPPKINFNRFYQHLILAHIIFAAVTLSALDEDNLNPENQ